MGLLKTAGLLLAGVTLQVATSQAQQAKPAKNQLAQHKTKQLISFHQNQQTSTLKINPAYEQELREIIPFGDTTRKFYPSARTTTTGYSTPSEEAQGVNRDDVNIIDKTILVRETVNARLGFGLIDQKQDANKIFAIHVKQCYSKDKQGKIGSYNLMSYSDDPENVITVFLNKEKSVEVITINDAGYKVESYAFGDSVKNQTSLLGYIAAGEDDPIGVYNRNFSDNPIKPVVTRKKDIYENIPPEKRYDRSTSTEGPLFGFQAGMGSDQGFRPKVDHHVVEFKNDTGYKFGQFFNFKL